MQIGGREYNVRSGLVAFLVISAGSAVAIFWITSRTGVWSGARHMRPAYLAAACVLTLLQWCLNAARFQILVNSLGNGVGFFTSLRAFMANVFLSAVTPSQTGGGPIQIYILNQAGVPIAKGFAGCLMGAVLSVVCLFASTVAILAGQPRLRAEFGTHLTGVITTVVIVFSALAALFFLSIFKLDVVKRLTGRTLLATTRLLRIGKRLGLTKRVLGGFDEYRESIFLLAGKRKGRVGAAFALTFAGIAVNCLIALALLKSLNVGFDASRVYLAQFILLFIAYFSPTPGASGIAEFSNYWILSSLSVTAGVLGIYTVMWRFFTSYAGVAVGGVVMGAALARKESA